MDDTRLIHCCAFCLNDLKHFEKSKNNQIKQADEFSHVLNCFEGVVHDKNKKYMYAL